MFYLCAQRALNLRAKAVYESLWACLGLLHAKVFRNESYGVIVLLFFLLNFSMEDIIVSVPKSDAQFVARLLEKMGYCIRNKKLKGSNAPSFRQLFEKAQKESSIDHEWTLDEINAEISAARNERTKVCSQ